MGAMTLVLSLWAMLEQVFFLLGVRLPGAIIAILVRSAHPLWIIYGALLVLVGASFLVPAWAVLRKGRGLVFIQAAMERLGLLMMLYLVLDIGALVIVVIRNV